MYQGLTYTVSKKNFVNGKGWSTTSMVSGSLIGDKADIQKTYGSGSKYTTHNIDGYTSAPEHIYLVAQWKANTTKPPKTTTTKKTTSAKKSWTVNINANGGEFKALAKKSLTLKENGQLPTCSSYVKRSGYSCKGWNLYRDERSGSKYFVTGKGWSGTASNASLFGNGFNLSNIAKNTGNGVTFYIKAVWAKE